MNCYYHPDRDAVEICPVCHRQICAECTAMLVGKVMCKQCSIKVASRVHQKLVEEQSEERKFVYSIPGAFILVGIMFTLLSVIITDSLLLPILVGGLILLVIGVVYFVFIYLARKKQRYLTGGKLTRKRKIGWAVFGIGIIYLVIMQPITVFLFDFGLITTLLSLGGSFALIIVGAVLTKP